MQSVLDIFCKANYTKNAKHALHAGTGRPPRAGGKGWSLIKTRIAQLRKERRLSQGELAEAVGVTRQTITSLEVGRYTASLVLAYKIARYFDLPIEEVFDFSELEE